MAKCEQAPLLRIWLNREFFPDRKEGFFQRGYSYSGRMDFQVGRKPWKLAYKGVRPTLKMNPVNNPGLVFLFSHFYWGSIRPFFIEWSVNGMFFQFWWKDATQWWGLVQKKTAEACLRKGSSVQAARDSFPFNQNSFWSIYFSSLHPNGLIWLFLLIKEFAP